MYTNKYVYTAEYKVNSFSHTGSVLTSRKPQWCAYYQGQVSRKDCLYLVAILKSFDHIALDRTIDPQESIFEFYVPQGMEQSFLDIMAHMAQEGIVSNLHKLPNRLESGDQDL